MTPNFEYVAPTELRPHLDAVTIDGALLTELDLAGGIAT